MVDIRHRIGVKDATAEQVYAALTTVPGLAGWWTDDTSGDADVGGVLAFRFPPVGGFDMKVLEAQPAHRVSWRVVDGPPEWVGTTVDWELRQTATTRSCCSPTATGRNRGSSCTIAAPSGERSC